MVVSIDLDRYLKFSSKYLIAFEFKFNYPTQDYSAMKNHSSDYDKNRVILRRWIDTSADTCKNGA